MRKVGLLIVLFITATCASPLPPPSFAGDGYLGVGFELEDRPDVLERCPAGAGIRLTSVAVDGPAAAAGLTASHVITSIDEVTFSQNRTWANFSETVRRYGPGDRARVRGLVVEEIRTRDGRPLSDVTQQSALKDILKSVSDIRIEQKRRIRRFETVVTLGKRPSIMDRDPVEIPEPGRYRGRDTVSPLFETVPAVSRDAVTAIWEELRDRWARDENRDLLGVLDTVRYLHLHPLEVEAAANGWSDRLLDGDADTVAREILGLPATDPWQPDPVAETPNAVLRQIHVFLDRVEARRSAALEPVAASLDAVRQGVLQLAGHFPTHIYLSEYEPESGQAAIRSALTTADSVVLAPFVDGLVESRRFFSEDRTRRMLAVLTPRWGQTIRLGDWTLRLGTDGNDRFRGRADVMLDPGGDDIYQILPGDRPILAGVDLAGDDVVTVNGDFGPAAAFAGSAYWLDVAGDDTYRAPRMAFGFAALGAALHEDDAGDDRYIVGGFGLGAALFGHGHLLDRRGDDVYLSELAAQGSAWMKATAFAVDVTGDDTWSCGLGRGSSYGTNQIFRGHGQGSGFGLRGIVAGGVGGLVDGGGDDRYAAGNFSQGCGYAQATGFLVDRGGGRDGYHGSRYCQAAAAHGAVGFLDEDGGDDRYEGLQGSLQGGGWDLSSAIFIDRGGDDVHAGGQFFTHGASAHNGFGVFLDLSGDDVYGKAEGYGRATPNNYHGGRSLSFFVDGDGRDRYAAPAFGDGKRCFGSALGFFDDRSATPGAWTWLSSMN